MNPRAVASEGSLIGAHGSNQGNNNLTLKGWPLTGLDRLRSGILQQQNSLMQSPQSYNQLLQQQQLMLVQQNLAFPSSNDLDNRRMKMLLNNRNLVIGKDGQLSSVDVLNVGSPVQVGCSVLPRGDADMLMKLQQQQMQSNNQHQQPYSQHPLSDFNIVLEDQSGKKVELGSETWERRLSLFVTRRLLSLLTILLYSKSIWFGAISCSEISAGLQWQEFALKKTRKGIERAHGKDSSRVRLLQGGRYPELALYLRLELLEGVVAYHSGQYDKSRKVLTSAQEKFTKLQVPDEALSLVMSMGFKERDSKRALRMSNQDVSSAVDFLVEQDKESPKTGRRYSATR